MPGFLLQVHRQAAPRAGPEPAKASWVTSVTVWAGLIVGFWVLTTYQEAVKCILYEEIPMCFTSRLAFAIDSSWRRHKSEGSMNKCRSYAASWQTSWEDATSASLLALFVCFSSLEKVMIWIQSPLWVVLWLKALVPRESRHSLWFKGNLNADTQHLFFLWGLVMDFPALGYCRGKILFRFVRVVAERLGALEVSVQDWAACAEAVLPSTVKRVLYSASDCLIFSMSAGRVAG